MRSRFLSQLGQARLLWVALILLAGLNPGPAPAQDSSPPADGRVHILDEIIVTADPDESQTGDVDQFLDPGFSTVITRDRFDGRVEDLASVLSKEAGVQVSRSGGLGGFSTISLRGSSSEQVLVFLDGIQLNDASGGGVDLGGVSLADVEAIEIYRGTAPINFARGGIGGVVNIRTLRKKKGLRGALSLGAGSFNTQEVSGFINHKPGKFDYLVSLDQLASGNDYPILNDQGTTFNARDDEWQDRANNEVRQYNALVKAGYDFTDDFRLEILNQYFSKDQSLPTWDNDPRASAYLDTQRNISRLRFSGERLGPALFNASLQLDYLRREEEYRDKNGEIGLGTQHAEYLTDRYGGGLFFEWPTAWNVFSLTGDLRREEYHPRDLLNKSRMPRSDRLLTGLAAQNSLVLWDDRLALTPALRYTSIIDHMKSGTDIFDREVTAKTVRKHYLTPQAGLKFLVLDWLTLKANAAQYVREPSFYELFGDRGFFLGNTDLKAEKGTNWDAGLEATWRPGLELFNLVSVQAAYFRSDVRDLIAPAYDSRGIGRSINIGRAEIQGLETRFSVEFLKIFRFEGNFTRQHTENKGNEKEYRGKRLPGRYESAYAGRLEALWMGVKAWVEKNRETGRYYDRANLLKARDKSEVNAGISFDFKPVLLTFEGKNLEDRRYEDFNGYPLPGTSYWIKIKYSF
ncbi:MAG: TonB-dependent receptor [Pseudomonadota bacterium]